MNTEKQESVEIDLDKLEQECTNLRKLCGRSSFPGDACVKGRECEPCRERAKSADIIEKLVRRLRAAEKVAATMPDLMIAMAGMMQVMQTASPQDLESKLRVAYKQCREAYTKTYEASHD